MNERLNQNHIFALQALAANPAAYISAGTLGMLRRRGLVGKRQEFVAGRSTTTSPLTDAGRAALAAATTTTPPTNDRKE